MCHSPSIEVARASSQPYSSRSVVGKIAASASTVKCAPSELLAQRRCDTCAGTGYKGRQGLYEVMALSSPLRRGILKGGSTEELRDIAVQEGMLTLRMDGMVKVKKGVTTLEEVVKETAAG